MEHQESTTQPFHPVQDSGSLPDRVAEQLRSTIFEGRLQPGERLSNEPEMAKALGVSRSTLRSALDRLVRDGLIIRKRGVGTFVTTHSSVPTNLNVNIGATALIRASGAIPGTAELKVTQTASADSRVLEWLDLSPASPVIVVERVRTVNGRRVIFANEFMPANLLHGPGRRISLLQLESAVSLDHSLHVFFRKSLGMEVHHGIARLQPATANELIATGLQIPHSSLLMYLEQVDYDADGQPLLLSDEYWVADAFAFSVYRSS
jgi:GntR family transcriptional regulator